MNGLVFTWWSETKDECCLCDVISIIDPESEVQPFSDRESAGTSEDDVTSQ